MRRSDALKLFGFQVNASPSENEIKKQYRSLAKIHHPDKGGNPEKFKEVNKAYQILLEKEPEHVPMDDMFSGVFGGFQNIFTKFQNPKVQKVIPKKRVKLSVNELFNGKIIQVDITNVTKCQQCTGTGTKSKIICSECRGNGKIMRKLQTPIGITIQNITCTMCKGIGSVGEGSNKLCSKCFGKKELYEKTVKDVRIPPAVQHNTRIVVNEKEKFPVEVIIQHPSITDDDWKGWVFNTETRHIQKEITISLEEALLGKRMEIETPNNQKLDVIVPSGIQSGGILKYQDKGLPACPQLQLPPSLAEIKVNVNIPKIREEHKDKVRELFRLIGE